MLIKSDGLSGARVLTTMRQTAAAGLRYLISAFGAVIAGDIDNFNHVAFIFAPTDRQHHAFLQNRPFLVYAAAVPGLRTGGYPFEWEALDPLPEIVTPERFSYFSDYPSFGVDKMILQFTIPPSG